MDILATLSELQWVRDERWETWEEGERPSVSYVGERRKEFKEIRVALNALSDLRNEFVHKRWVRGIQGSPATLVVTARGTLTRKMVGRSNAEIAAAARGIAEQSKRLRALFKVDEAQEDEE